MKKLNENQKVTLTVGQLKQLVTEAVWQDEVENLHNFLKAYKKDYPEKFYGDPKSVAHTYLYYRFTQDGQNVRINDMSKLISEIIKAQNDEIDNTQDVKNIDKTFALDKSGKKLLAALIKIKTLDSMLIKYGEKVNQIKKSKYPYWKDFEDKFDSIYATPDGAFRSTPIFGINEDNNNLFGYEFSEGSYIYRDVKNQKWIINEYSERFDNDNEVAQIIQDICSRPWHARAWDSFILGWYNEAKQYMKKIDKIFHDIENN